MGAEDSCRLHLVGSINDLRMRTLLASVLPLPSWHYSLQLLPYALQLKSLHLDKLGELSDFLILTLEQLLVLLTQDHSHSLLRGGFTAPKHIEPRRLRRSGLLFTFEFHLLDFQLCLLPGLIRRDASFHNPPDGYA